jgi:hypothetical protein
MLLDRMLLAGDPVGGCEAIANILEREPAGLRL